MGTADEMLCRWAEQKYGYANVTEVHFTAEDGEFYSEETDSDPATLDVTIVVDGKPVTVDEVIYATELVQEIVGYAMGSGNVR